MRRLLIATAGLLLFSIAGRHPITSNDADGVCPVPSESARGRSTLSLSEATLLALELENGCVDDAADADDAWPPGWNAASIAGGDVPPSRVVSDPYPTLHSVVVDPDRNRVFFSDPNRHALWSYDRLAAAKPRE